MSCCSDILSRERLGTRCASDRKGHAMPGSTRISAALLIVFSAMPSTTLSAGARAAVMRFAGM
jgi:hypothetical protein